MGRRKDGKLILNFRNVFYQLLLKNIFNLGASPCRIFYTRASRLLNQSTPLHVIEIVNLYSIGSNIVNK